MGSPVRYSQSRVAIGPSVIPAAAPACRAPAASPRRRFAASPVGVLLLDSAFRPAYYNAAAAGILAYPGTGLPARSWEALLSSACFHAAINSHCVSPSAVDFTSGRRRYVSRAFRLDRNGKTISRFHPSTLVVLERECTQPVDITRWSEEFQLTCRERETVTFLLRGLTSKEIAAEMAISPNTVKCFLKLVMAKVGAPTRTAIVARILERTAEFSSRAPAGVDG
jgi:DNA-binding CsgD family transcriptional regulator